MKKTKDQNKKINDFLKDFLPLYTSFFKKKKLKKLLIEENGIKVSLKQKDKLRNVTPNINSFPQPSVSVNTLPEKTSNPQPQKSSKEEMETLDSGKKIVAPLAGTYYNAPNPDSGPYVKVGDQVSKNTKICIIESMKVMNEIEAKMSGKISKILVKDGQAIKMGQALFLVE